MARVRFQAASRDLNGPRVVGIFRERSQDSRADRNLIGRGRQEVRRARELRAALRDLAEKGPTVGDQADKEALAGHAASQRESHGSRGRVVGGRFLGLSRDSRGRNLRVDRLAKGRSQDRERGRADHLARRAGGRRSRSLANQRGDLIGRRVAVEDLVAESRGPENRARDRQAKAAGAGPRPERDSNLAAGSGSRVDFRSRVDFQSPEAKVRPFAANRAGRSAGARIGPVDGRVAGSAAEGWRAELLGELSQRL